MARAKRTDRAEARARYRAYLASQYQPEGDETDATDATDADEAVQASSRGSAARAGRASVAPAVAKPAPGERLGFFQAFKNASRPVHYMDDLRYLPTLLMRTNAIWPVVVISVASMGYALTLTRFDDPAVGLLLATTLASPCLLQPVLSGFLAPRATWLAGIVSSLIAGVCFVIVVSYWTSGHMSGSTPQAVIDFANFKKVVTEVYTPTQVALSAVTLGALLGAGAAWYKRFLQGTMGRNKTAEQRGTAQRPRGKSVRRSTGR